MPRRILATLALLLASAASQAHAGMLTLSGLVTAQKISATSSIPGDSFYHDPISASPFNATYDGTGPLNLYCVDLRHTIDPTHIYQATVRTDGIINGALVANAGKVAWLLTTYAAGADTANERNALQAAIWRTVYGSAFQLDGSDNWLSGNSTAVESLYEGYLAGLGSKTAAVSGLSWYSPVNSNGSPAQGLVGLRVSPSAVPEPASLAMCGMASLAGLGAWARRRVAAEA